MLLSGASSPVTSRKGTPARASLDAPGADQLLAFDEDVLGKDLIGPAGARHLRGDEKLADLRGFRWPIRGRARCRRQIGRQAPASVPADRNADVGAARPASPVNRTSPRRSGVRATSAQTRSAVSVGESGVFPPSRSRSRRIRGVGRSRMPISPSVLRLRAGGARNQPVNRLAMILPVDEAAAPPRPPPGSRSRWRR